MEPTEDLGEYMTLIVRIRQDDAGRLCGVVERVRTGEKARLISVRVFSATGEIVGNVVLDIRKSSAGFRLQQALFVKDSCAWPRDLELLDTNALPLSTLSKVFARSSSR